MSVYSTLFTTSFRKVLSVICRLIFSFFCPPFHYSLSNFPKATMHPSFSNIKSKDKTCNLNILANMYKKKYSHIIKGVHVFKGYFYSENLLHAVLQSFCMTNWIYFFKQWIFCRYTTKECFTFCMVSFIPWGACNNIFLIFNSHRKNRKSLE